MYTVGGVIGSRTQPLCVQGRGATDITMTPLVPLTRFELVKNSF